MYAVMAERERGQISERIRATLPAAKARSVVSSLTGRQNLRQHVAPRQAVAHAIWTRLRPVLGGFTAQGMSLRAMVMQL